MHHRGGDFNTSLTVVALDSSDTQIAVKKTEVGSELSCYSHKSPYSRVFVAPPFT